MPPVTYKRDFVYHPHDFDRNSLQLLGLGLFSLLAANQPSLLYQALATRLFLHLLGSYLFWQEDAGLTNVALIELGFAVVNVLALAVLRSNGVRR